MGKNKYKRKQEHGQKHSHQQKEQIRLPDSIVIPTKYQEKTSPTTERKASKKKEFPMAPREMAKHSSFTDWCIMVFTGVLAVVAIYQFVIMDGQLATMRKDQRPWIKAVADIALVRTLEPIHGATHLTNNGKTPAKAITGDFSIEQVKNGEEPKLDYSESVGHFTQGTLFPGETSDVKIQRIKGLPEKEEADLMTNDEFEDFTNLKTFYVVYGTVRYEDFFGVNHWTKFCQFIVPSNVNGAVTATHCSKYGDVDSN